MRALRNELSDLQNANEMPNEEWAEIFIRRLLEGSVLCRRVTPLEINLVVNFTNQILAQDMDHDQQALIRAP